MDPIPRQTIKELIDIHKKLFFVKPEEARDSEVLGVLINHYFDWDAIEILDTASTALMDANLDKEGKILKDKMNELLNTN